MNRVFLVGNITSDIYFDRFLMHGEKRSYLRLILMAQRPRSVMGMRIVLWDQKAELYFPYLKKGSELAVIGQFETRKYKDRWIHEVVSENLLLLRHIDWERGESLRQQYHLPSPGGTTSDVFLVGDVLGGFQLERSHPGDANGSGEAAVLLLRLKNDQHPDGLRVTVLDALAELVHPYLQPGSKIAVDGYLQTHVLDTGRQAVEVRTRNMTFLDNINWAAGKAAQPQERREIEATMHGD